MQATNEIALVSGLHALPGRGRLKRDLEARRFGVRTSEDTMLDSMRSMSMVLALTAERRRVLLIAALAYAALC